MGPSLWESLRCKGNSMTKFSGSHPKINNRRKTNQMTSRRWNKILLTKKQAKFTIFILGDYKIVTLFKTHALWPTSDVYQLLNTTHHIQPSDTGWLPPPRLRAHLKLFRFLKRFGHINFWILDYNFNLSSYFLLSYVAIIAEANL